MEPIAAIYCRLSKDDGTIEDSSSIQSQKDSLTKYCKEHGFEIYKIYCDDGYKGTNDQRPSFSELIEDIKNGYINILLTKDLSRLGRNYIKTGYYTEQFFPEHNIRYIAVNDNYDSANNQNEFIPFKNIMNEFYAKDISKKIRYSYNTRVERGELIPTSVPYGYYKEGKLVKIDEKAALIVKLIFEEYIKYGKPLVVAEMLNEKGILPPTAHYYNRKGKLNSNPPKNNKWTRGTIGKIIRQQAYKGIHVAKKTYNISFKDKKRRLNSKDKWVYIEGIYEPIIDSEMWDKANKLMDSQIHNPYTLDINKYSGVMYCGHCGKRMHLVKIVRKNDVFYEYLCKNYENNCSGHSIRITELDERVKYGLLRMKRIILSNEDEFRQQAIEFSKNSQSKNKNVEENIIESLMARDRVLDNLIEKVIEKNLSGF